VAELRGKGLAAGIAGGLGIAAGALLAPQHGPIEPVAGLALVAGVVTVLTMLVVGVLMTIPSDRRTDNLVRVIRAVKGRPGLDVVDPPESRPDAPEAGAAEAGRPPGPQPLDGREAAPTNGSRRKPAPGRNTHFSRPSWTRLGLGRNRRGSIYPDDFAGPSHN
jgi:hypothetical protein